MTPDGRFLFRVGAQGIGIFNVAARKFHFFCRHPHVDVPTLTSGLGFTIRTGISKRHYAGGAISQDFRFGAIAGSSLVVFDLGKGTVLTELSVKATAVAFSSNSNELIVGMGDGTVHFLATGTWKITRRIPGLGGKVKSVGLDNRSGILVLGVSGQPMQFWLSDTLERLTAVGLSEVNHAWWRQSADGSRGVAVDSAKNATLVEFAPAGT